MYTEIHDWKEFEQKVLYFKLNNAFNVQTESESNHKFAGVYAIFKDDICLYVGQSKNIASRLATHMKGKYTQATEIYAWNIEDVGYSDYMQRSTKSKEEILLNCEKWLMTKLKPIENISIDMDFKLEENQIPEICLESFSGFTLELHKYKLSIYDYHYEGIENIIIDIDYLHYTNIIEDETRDKIIESISSHEKVSFDMKGFKNEH